MGHRFAIRYTLKPFTRYFLRQTHKRPTPKPVTVTTNQYGIYGTCSSLYRLRAVCSHFQFLMLPYVIYRIHYLLLLFTESLNRDKSAVIRAIVWSFIPNELLQWVLFHSSAIALRSWFMKQTVPARTGGLFLPVEIHQSHSFYHFVWERPLSQPWTHPKLSCNFDDLQRQK